MSNSPSTGGLPSSSLATLCRILEEDKTAFLDDLESSIYTYIVGTGRQCIAIVQKIPKEGSTNADDPDSQYTLYKYELKFYELGGFKFVEVLFKFMMNMHHEGYELDSALTAPILNIITRKFVDLYEAHNQEISDELLNSLRNNETLLESFISRLSDAVSSKISKTAQKQIVHLTAHSTRHTLEHQIADFASEVAKHHVISLAAKALSHALARHIAHTLRIFLNGAAFKSTVHTLMHKMIIGVISSAVVKFLVASFGGAMGAGSLSYILLPIMAYVIYNQVKKFPTKLGRELSESVRIYLNSNFEGLNRAILEDVFKILQKEELLKAVAADKDVREMLLTVAGESNLTISCAFFVQVLSLAQVLSDKLV